ncbi:MAG: putative damage-inducible protein DinB [Candidatus Krumholzibacteriia bacterium]|jgi:uncharacterized damage-inducible protein DinB
MPAFTIEPPAQSEHDPYYYRYIKLVPAGNTSQIMTTQMNEFKKFIGSVPAEKAGFRYAEGKWSIKEMLGHLIDTERVFMHRALSVARGDEAALAGFDQDDWCVAGRFDDQELDDLLTQWLDVRRAALSMLASLPAGATEKTGHSNGAPITVRALVYVPVGHVIYHWDRLVEDYGLADTRG